MNQESSQTLCIAKTLAWEFWARGWFSILAGVCGAALFPAVLFTAMLSTSGQRSLHELAGVEPLQILFYSVTIVNCGLTIVPALENPNRRYTLPASNLLLVAIPMACAMLTIFAQYSIVAVILNCLFDARWSVVRPGLLAAVLMAWCQVMLWSTWNSPGLRTVALLTNGLALTLTTMWWAANSVVPKQAELPGGVNSWQIFLFGLATAICAGAGVGGFSKLRAGAGIDLRRMLDWLRERIPFGTTARSTPFPSPQSTQFWLEWNRRGWVLPAVYSLVAVATVSFVGVAVVLFVLDEPARGFNDLLETVSFLFFLPLAAIGFYSGARSSEFEFSAFDGSRPLTDDQIANAILKSATFSLIGSALIWVASMSLIYLIAGERLQTSGLYLQFCRTAPLVLLGHAVLGGIGGWSVISFLTSLVLAGKKVFGIAVWLAFGVLLMGALLSRTVFPDARREFESIYSSICLACCLVGCGMAFVVSWRRRLVSARTLWLAAVLVITSVMTAVWLGHLGEPFLSWKGLLFVLGCCGLTPIPLAAAPLAVYVNRHR